MKEMRKICRESTLGFLSAPEDMLHQRPKEKEDMDTEGVLKSSPRER